MSKGIRVNQLAKELGVESKSILAKCREEGLAEKVPNHMSVLSLGLAETVREWFSHGDGGVSTAVETAAPVEVATKPRTARRPAKKKSEESSSDVSTMTETMEQPGTETRESFVETTVTGPAPVTTPAPAAPVAEAPKAKAPSVTTSPVVEQEAPSITSAPAAPATPPSVPVMEAPSPTVALEVPKTVASSAPAITQAPAMPHAPSHAGPHAPHSGGERPQLRKTITLANREGQPPVEKKAAPVQAPKLLVPKPAVMEGPRIVREEKPDHVPAPRPRGPRTGGPGAAADSPSFVQARRVAVVVSSAPKRTTKRQRRKQPRRRRGACRPAGAGWTAGAVKRLKSCESSPKRI